MAKGLGKGWWFESQRHRLARLGIKTGRKTYKSIKNVQPVEKGISTLPPITREEEERAIMREEQFLKSLTGEEEKDDRYIWEEKELRERDEVVDYVKDKYKSSQKRRQKYFELMEEKNRILNMKKEFREYKGRVELFFDILDEQKKTSKNFDEFVEKAVDFNLNQVKPKGLWGLFFLVATTEYYGSKKHFENIILEGVFGKKGDMYEIKSPYFFENYWKSPKKEREKWLKGIKKAENLAIGEYQDLKKEFMKTGQLYTF